jgi:hypothetical protein
MKQASFASAPQTPLAVTLGTQDAANQRPEKACERRGLQPKARRILQAVRLGSGLAALGCLVVPVLARAEQKAPAAAPNAAPSAAEAAKPSATDAAKPSATTKPSDSPKADATAPAADTDATPDTAGQTLPEAQPTPAPGAPTGAFNPLPAWPEAGTDAAELKRQNSERPRDAADKSDAHDVFAEDCWE